MSLRGLPVRRAVLRRKGEVPELEGRAGKLRLDLNENTAGCSRAVTRALRRLSPQQIAMYPEYRRVTSRLARAAGVRPEEMHLTNGGDDALRIVYDVFVDSGSTVLFPEPTFPMYRFFAGVYDARVIAPRFDREMNCPVAELLAALRRRPRVLFLANPNNPTGNILPPADLRRILRAARRTVVVVDEAYVEFSGGSATSWIRRYPNLVVARTYSKAAGLAGLRLGCLIARAEVTELFRRVAPPFNVNAAALVAADAATRDRGAARRYVAEVRRARGEFKKQLAWLGYRSFPSVANFVLVDFGPRGPEIVRHLKRQGILLSDRSRDFRRRGMVRVSIGTRREMRRLVSALAHIARK
jgi:histidinol-phosphate aminotransferase